MGATRMRGGGVSHIDIDWEEFQGDESRQDNYAGIMQRAVYRVAGYLECI